METLTIRVPESCKDWPVEYQMLYAFLRKLKTQYKIGWDTMLNLWIDDIRHICDTESKDMLDYLYRPEGSKDIWTIANYGPDFVGINLINQKHDNPLIGIEVTDWRAICVWVYLLGASNHNLIDSDERLYRTESDRYKKPFYVHHARVFKRSSRL